MEIETPAELTARAGYQYAMRKVMRGEWPNAAGKVQMAEYDDFIKRIETLRKEDNNPGLQQAFREFWDFLRS